MSISPSHAQWRGLREECRKVVCRYVHEYRQQQETAERRRASRACFQRRGKMRGRGVPAAFYMQQAKCALYDAAEERRHAFLVNVSAQSAFRPLFFSSL